MTPGTLLVRAMTGLLALHVLVAAYQLWNGREVRQFWQLVWSVLVLVVFQVHGVSFVGHLVDGFLKGHLNRDVQLVDWQGAWRDVLHFWQVVFRGKM